MDKDIYIKIEDLGKKYIPLLDQAIAAGYAQLKNNKQKREARNANNND